MEEQAVCPEALPAEQEQVNAYYAELDPEVRLQQLKALCAQQPDSALSSLRKALWKQRYEAPGQSGRVDTFLWQCVNLLAVYRMDALKPLRKSGGQEVRAAVQAMGVEKAAALGESGEAALQREFGNAVRRYLSVSAQDRSYRRRWFGIVRVGDEECAQKLARDAWRLSEGIRTRFSPGKEWEPFAEGAKDAFFALNPDAEALWCRCAEKEH